MTSNAPLATQHPMALQISYMYVKKKEPLWVLLIFESI
uniref:Uncharacterized protein n=1 Tax=Bacillus subtilis subsp. natto TaxID=86029 RepID=E9RJI1_BACNA|nr:hypothetical protein [Bacillus subtilis subsp. natto]